MVVALEEVWNKFLLSPFEVARYVDEFQSPWAKAYFDVGNVVFYGFPQDWIRTLGSRIVRLHIKGFKLNAAPGPSPGVTSAKGTSTGSRCAKRSTRLPTTAT